MSSLLQSLEEVDEKLAESLIENGDQDVFAENNKGQTALHLASARGFQHIVDILLDRGTDLCAKDINGNTPLHLATRNNNISVIKSLLFRQPKVAYEQNNNGDTPMHIACRFGYLECVMKLVEHNVTADMVNENLDTPLLVAIKEKHENVVIYLLHNAPGNLDIFNNEGNAPIHVAVQEGLLNVVETIINMGHSFEYPNDRGLYPLHIATRHGHVEIVRYLCIAGSDPQQRSADNIKPEITAIKNNQKEILSIFTKLNTNSARENYIQQLVISHDYIQNINLLFFGHSNAGKSSIIRLMKLGLFSMLLDKSRNTLRTINTNRTNTSQDQCNNGNEINLTEYNTTNTSNYYNHDGTKGITVQKEKLSGINECTFWDFSGEDTYYNSYHHVIQNTPNKVVVIVYNEQQSSTEVLKTVRFWLSFVQARLQITEPISKNGISNHLVPVIIVATHNGQRICRQSDQLIKTMKDEYGHVFQVYEKLVLFDIMAVDSLSVKNFKEAISISKKRLHFGYYRGDIICGANSNGRLNKLSFFARGGYKLLDDPPRENYYNTKSTVTRIENIPRMSGFCEAVQNFLPKLRKIANPFPVLSWKTFCDTIHLEVNPLATVQHLNILLIQLQNLGEVLFLKSGLQPDLIVISPNWFGSNIIGTLFSVDFLISQTRMSGSYQANDFQIMFPHYDAMSVLQLLETMKICVQYDNDGDIEYEFPAYIIREKDETLWKPWGNNVDCCYGGIRLSSQPQFLELFTSIFIRIQVELRYLQNNYYEDMDSYLYQWYGGTVLCISNIECMVSLEQDGCIEIKIRGSKSSSYTCFYFLEEILHSINLVLIETCPGMKVIKEFLSPSNLSEHYVQPHGYGVDDIFYAVRKTSDFKSLVVNPLTGKNECVLDLIAFGCDQVENMLSCTDSLPLTELNTMCRQELSRLIDPVHPLGRDWALFALNIGLDSKVQLFDNGPTSPFLALIDTWATVQPAPTIGTLVDQLNELGREEVALAVLQNIQCFRIKVMDINNCSVTLNQL
ncbi:death-associated protein kinase 1-like isoform X1 [Aphis gossypii]|uniref:death-associated protein kinase 1-like isoform X1 n=1 Tax=Aphis gossypii TaxID=80765 RepID=UPI002158C40F|nr:death-associated protein kinase 1-like isoform X1 [Aphis gossypii]